ncbi:MAG: glycosyltransferase [Pseudomonadota bacterium]
MSQRPRKILFLHCCDSRTIDIVVYHLQGFAHYGPEDEIFYHDIRMPVTPELRQAQFDAAIVNFEALATIRYEHRLQGYIDKLSFILDTCAVRVAITMDDYTGPGYLDQFLVAMKVHHVHTPLPDHVAALYPESLKVGVTFHGTLTGYLDDAFVEKADRFRKDFHAREIYFGNRIRYLPAEYGRWARMKGDMNADFGKILEARGHTIDLSFRHEDRIEGDDWVRFLCNMKFTVNPQGGTSIIDRHHKIITAASKFRSRNPDATFEEIEAACFPGEDGKHIMKAAGPRLIQAAVCGAVQLMPVDDYPADLRPGEDYIVLETDMSNADEALAIMADEDRCRQIADNARERVLACRDVWFDSFVREVLAHIPAEVSASLPAAKKADPLTGPAGHFETLHRSAREISHKAKAVPHEAGAVFARLISDCMSRGTLGLAQQAWQSLAGQPETPDTASVMRAASDSTHGPHSSGALAARLCAGFALCFPSPEARPGLGHILMEVPELFAELGLNGDLKYCIGVQDQRLTAPEVLHAHGEDGAQYSTQRGEIASFTNNASSAVHTRLPTLQNVGEALRDFPGTQDTVAYTFSTMFLCCGRRGKTRNLLRKFSPLVAGVSDSATRTAAAAQISRYLDLEGDAAGSAQVWQKFRVQDSGMLAQLSWGERANASGRLSPVRLGVLGAGSLLAHARRKVFRG